MHVLSGIEKSIDLQSPSVVDFIKKAYYCMYSWSVSGTFNEVLIEIAEGYTIDTDPVVCGDEEE